MAEQPEEPGWAFDVVGALKAKLDALREAEADLQEKTRELEEERDGLQAGQARLAEKEQTLLQLDEDLARQREGIHDRSSDFERAQTALAQAQERLAANEARLKEWAQSLHAAEQQVVSLKDDFKARQAEAALKLAQVHDRLVAVMHREEALGDREAAFAESLERVKKVSEAILLREKVLADQAQALGDLQREWSASVRKREDEFAGAVTALGNHAEVQSLGEAELASLLTGLRAEAEKLAGQRQSLVARERRVLEFEDSLTAVIGSVRSGSEGRSGTSIAIPAAPAEKTPPASPAPPAPVAQNGKAEVIPKSPKGRAMEKMARVLDLVKRAQATGRESDGIRELLRQIRRGYEAKAWADVEALSERALEKLTLLITASS